MPRPPKGFGVALNYRSHAIESGRDLPTEPHLFGKMENCVCGPYDQIVVPAGRDEVDYETELVIVFGRTCAKASEDCAAKREPSSAIWSLLRSSRSRSRQLDPPRERSSPCCSR